MTKYIHTAMLSTETVKLRFHIDSALKKTVFMSKIFKKISNDC